MKKEEVYEHLDASALDVKLKPTEWHGKESDWSKSFVFHSAANDKEAISKHLYEIFKVGIPYDQWREKFLMAVGGDGNEGRKIATLHSSSLLALLFFSGVSKDNPIIHDGEVYTNVFFEVKNKVGHTASPKDRPSNIDIMLVSEDKDKLLCLESKFTEYLNHGKVDLAEKYKNFCKTFFEINSNTDIHLEGDTLQLKDGRNSRYIAGIKQMFSHIIGLATEPDASMAEDIQTIIQNAKQIVIKEIIFIWEDKESKDFIELYRKTFKDFDSEYLGKCLSGGNYDKKKIDRIRVGADVLSYQDLYMENMKHRFPETVIKYYRF